MITPSSKTSTILAALAASAAALAACSKPATQATAPPLAPAAAPPVAPALPTTTAVSPADGSGASGYSCTFPGPAGRSILARFTVDGATAHDDQGLAFNVLTNSPTALVLAHARDDLGAAPGGDVGAYLIAIDRRTLGMVQASVGVNGPPATRHGRCIAG